MSTHAPNVHVSYPYLKIKTFSEFTLERLLPLEEQRPEASYQAVLWEELAGYGTALTILKILLCRTQRRISKHELITILWPEKEPTSRRSHALDVAVSILRRRILASSAQGSLLNTLRLHGETIFHLPEQGVLWVDADAFLELTAHATICTDERRLSLLTRAYSMAQGEFLEEDRISLWSQGRRQTINGARKRVLQQIVSLYIQRSQFYQAEELLFAFLEQFPADEDVLCQLLTLLAPQGRRHEALTIYHYVVAALHEIQCEPSSYTRELVKRMQMLHERYSPYTITYTATNAREKRQKEAVMAQREGGVVCTWKFIA